MSTLRSGELIKITVNFCQFILCTNFSLLLITLQQGKDISSSLTLSVIDMGTFVDGIDQGKTAVCSFIHTIWSISQGFCTKIFVFPWCFLATEEVWFINLVINWRLNGYRLWLTNKNIKFHEILSIIRKYIDKKLVRSPGFPWHRKFQIYL